MTPDGSAEGRAEKKIIRPMAQVVIDGLAVAKNDSPIDRPVGIKASTSGMTLIELLVVTAIVGILGAIAVQQFNGYRKRGYDAATRTDLRNAATAEYGYFTAKDGFTDSIDELVKNYGLRQTGNVRMQATITPDQFTLTAIMTNGCANDTGVFTFESTTGQITGKNCE
jgi:prepilin-type N-terminal cleavage/methylation domain-containing protein